MARVGDTRLVQATTAALLQAVRLKPHQQQQWAADEPQNNARLDVHCSRDRFTHSAAAVAAVNLAAPAGATDVAAATADLAAAAAIAAAALATAAATVVEVEREFACSNAQSG